MHAFAVALLRRATLGGLALAALAVVGRAQAPGGCQLHFTNTDATRFVSSKQPSGRYNTFSGGGVVADCVGQDVTLRADSAEYYEDQNLLLLIDNVHYSETRAKVDSRRMTYYGNEQRLLAEGDVSALLPSGSTMRGPRADYYRAVPGLRERTLLVAAGRPHLSLVQADSAGRPAEPVRVVASTIRMDGDSLIYAGGQVEIERVDITATADSAALDAGREFARLMRRPVVRSKGSRPFTLRGAVIDVYSSQRQLQRVVSATRADALSDSLHLTSDTIDLRVTANRLDRAFAWGKSRAHATTPDRDILADSIDVFMPAQRVREVRALRGAYAASATDSTKIRSGERDWLRGDTIVARFDSIAADTSRQPPPREIVASGHASSLYQIASQRGDLGRPAINYVRGRLITVALRERTVSSVTVLDQAAGMYLEPSDSAAAGRPGGRAAGRAGSVAIPGRASGTGAPSATPASPATPARPKATKPAVPATARPTTPSP